MVAAMMAAAALAGCSKGSSESAVTAAESTTEEEFAAADTKGTEPESEERREPGTVKITTSRGDVEIPMNPERVVVFDMGVLDSIDHLGVNVEVAVPTANLLSRLSKYESAVNAGGIKEPDMEAIYEFEPDLIIISGRQDAFYDELNKIAPTWSVTTDYTHLMEDFVDNYSILGQIFGKEEAVEAAIGRIQEQIASVREKAEQTDEKALILLTNDGSISAYGSGSRFGIIHDVLGVKAADEAIDASTHGQSVGYEYVSQVNPDILFVVDRAAIVAGTTDAGDTLDNDLVKSANAFQNGKVVYLNPENWYLAGAGLNTLPEMIEEVEGAISN